MKPSSKLKQMPKEVEEIDPSLCKSCF